MEPLALSLLLVLFIAALVRRPGVFSPALVLEGEGAGRSPGTTLPADDEEQMPETDRAPRPWLGWTVAGVAAARLVALAALHA
jgi:hypothetical protein